MDSESGLIERADTEVLTRFPRLASQPEVNKNYKALQSANPEDTVAEKPYRLYRFMVPPASINTPSIAFLGIVLTIHTVPVAQAQALWITAYLSNQLPSQQRGTPSFDPDVVAYNATLQTQFGKWRYPAAFGRRDMRRRSARRQADCRSSGALHRRSPSPGSAA